MISSLREANPLVVFQQAKEWSLPVLWSDASRFAESLWHTQSVEKRLHTRINMPLRISFQALRA